MPIKRLTIFSVLAAALFATSPLQATLSKTHGKAVPTTHNPHHKKVHAKVTHHASRHVRHGKLAIARHPAAHMQTAATDLATNGSTAGFGMLAAAPKAAAPQTFLTAQSLPIFHPTPLLARAGMPANVWSLQTANDTPTNSDRVDSVVATTADSDESFPAVDGAQNVTDLRKALIAMAMKLRDIRYVRGGRDPSTGFDCSGFVRYVFAHAVGMQLPNNSASQFLAGLKIKRADMKPGDLVFFHTHGKRRISHVGIYISDGRFIHSPTTGKSVEISSLDSGYWAKRFAGAKRPEAMAQVAGKG
jgi:cell wall-associated NlpC family hydrolase